MYWFHTYIFWYFLCYCMFQMLFFHKQHWTTGALFIHVVWITLVYSLAMNHVHFLSCKVLFFTPNVVSVGDNRLCHNLRPSCARFLLKFTSAWLTSDLTYSTIVSGRQKSRVLWSDSCSFPLEHHVTYDTLFHPVALCRRSVTFETHHTKYTRDANSCKKTFGNHQVNDR